MSYNELWAVLANWRAEFSTTEFARTFYSPAPNKVLHDLAKKGLLERVRPGRYRVRTSSEYVFWKYDVSKAYDFLAKVKFRYALTGVDAVYVWTHGGYNADRFFGFYPVHVKVLKSDLPKWKRILASEGLRMILTGERPRVTLFGSFFVLYPEERVEAVRVGSLMADPLDVTIEFCKRNIFTFEPALEMLDREYRLKLGMKYMETETNLV
ncbi:MAG: hypothetical protein MN733_22280 [Nitrososphaera sp.]|nr:hypothetical protein [Nitrososphaera sp.]